MLTCLRVISYKSAHWTRAAALLATKSFVLKKSCWWADCLLFSKGFCFWGLILWLQWAVCFLTIEYEKKEKRGRRSLRGLKEFRLWLNRLWRSRFNETTPILRAEMLWWNWCEFSSIQNNVTIVNDWILNLRVWSWLRTNAGGRLNTCKSNAPQGEWQTGE